MAVHAYSGVTGLISLSGTLVGFVSGDFTLSTSTGKYVVLGSNVATSHTRGLNSASGTIKRAWGVADADLYAWFNGDTALDIKFEAATGDASYTIASCVCTDFASEGLEAGSEGALMLNCSFEGLSWSRAN